MESIVQTSNIKDNYQFEKQLGEGSFAIVYKAIRKKDNQQVAIQVLDKLSMETEDQLALETQVEIMNNIDHPNIVKLFETYNEQTQFYMVMEIMTGGELFDRIVQKENYSELQACTAIKPIVDAIAYCHKLGIAHRDLKPENLLYSSPDPDATLKVSDFGLAKVINNDLMTTACGTPSYVAPEILIGKGYTIAVDYWSIGIILYVLLCGFPPFYEDNNEQLFDMIKKGEFEFPSPQWDPISSEAKDLISNLLKVDPKKRYNCEQILNHPWIKSSGKISQNSLTEVTERMRQFNARRRLRRAQIIALSAARLRLLVSK